MDRPGEYAGPGQPHCTDIDGSQNPYAPLIYQYTRSGTTVRCRTIHRFEKNVVALDHGADAIRK